MATSTRSVVGVGHDRVHGRAAEAGCPLRSGAGGPRGRGRARRSRPRRRCATATSARSRPRRRRAARRCRAGAATPARARRRCRPGRRSAPFSVSCQRGTEVVGPRDGRPPVPLRTPASSRGPGRRRVSKATDATSCMRKCGPSTVQVRRSSDCGQPEPLAGPDGDDMVMACSLPSEGTDASRPATAPTPSTGEAPRATAQSRMSWTTRPFATVSSTFASPMRAGVGGEQVAVDAPRGRRACPPRACRRPSSSWFTYAAPLVKPARASARRQRLIGQERLRRHGPPGRHG